MTLPIHMGGELVETIETLGASVDGFAQGEAVFGMVHTGALAEYAAVKAADLGISTISKDNGDKEAF